MKRARKITAIIMAAVLMMSMMTVNVLADQDAADRAAGFAEALVSMPGAGITNVTEFFAALHLDTDIAANVTAVPSGTPTFVAPTHGNSGNPFGIPGRVHGEITLTNTGANATASIDIALSPTPFDFGGIAQDRVDAAVAHLRTPGVASAIRALNPADVNALLAYVNNTIFAANGPFASVTVAAGTDPAPLAVTPAVHAEPTADPPVLDAVNGTITGQMTLSDGGATGSVVFSLTLFADLADHGGTVITGDGDVVYVDTTVWQVILPTSVAFDFILDPLGLIDATTVINAETNVVTTQGPGRIHPLSRGARVLNLSSNPILLNVEYSGSGDATFMAPATGATTLANLATRGDNPRNFVTNTATATSVNYRNAGNTVAMWLVPNLANMTNVAPLPAVVAPAAPVADALPVAPFAHATAALGFLVDSTPNNITFYINAATYNIVHEGGINFGYRIQRPGFGHGQIFQVGGLLNENTSWTTFNTGDDEIGIEVVFEWEAAPDISTLNTFRTGALEHPVTGAAHLRAQAADPAAAANLPNHVAFEGHDPVRNALVIPDALFVGFGASAATFVNVDATNATLNLHGTDGAVLIPFRGLPAGGTGVTVLRDNGDNMTASLNFVANGISIPAATATAMRGAGAADATWNRVWIITVEGVDHTVTINYVS